MVYLRLMERKSFVWATTKNLVILGSNFNSKLAILVCPSLGLSRYFEMICESVLPYIPIVFNKSTNVDRREKFCCFLFKNGGVRDHFSQLLDVREVLLRFEELYVVEVLFFYDYAGFRVAAEIVEY